MNQREEMLTAARERNLDQMNKALTDCMAVNLQNKREIEDAKIQLMALCQEEMEGAVQRKNWEELRECIKKIENTCVGDMVQQQAWFRKGKELLWKRELGEKAMIEAMRSNDEVDGDRPSDHVINVIVAAFIMVGVSEEEVDTWQKVNAKLKEISKQQLMNKVRSLDCSLLTPDQVDLVKKKLG
ncbi:uncharacterized protein LOC112574785 [Pomacea canaliculata]|uniref:uncharacterized protein LOC112574785 n=1 Tax=Pomacea canaliculata TaxID=400727 RepID=UPI000D72959E|nr:uncharacterized protein LOC112574785 [Pomacea canaliculata]XP_025111848.1 uncharacterized protein LOC112574785 [Pomacea canaliculata]